jgi:hypothetical protein
MSPSSASSLIMGDTSETPDQGGVGGSTSISAGAKTAAECRGHRAGYAAATGVAPGSSGSQPGQLQGEKRSGQRG